MTASIYVEHRVGGLAIGYTYFPDTVEYQMKEQVGENRAITCVEADEVPENVKKAISILLEEGN